MNDIFFPPKQKRPESAFADSGRTNCPWYHLISGIGCPHSKPITAAAADSYCKFRTRTPGRPSPCPSKALHQPASLYTRALRYSFPSASLAYSTDILCDFTRFVKGFALKTNHWEGIHPVLQLFPKRSRRSAPSLPSARGFPASRPALPDNQ